RIRRKLFYFRIVSACRKFSEKSDLPWYVASAIAGGFGFTLFILTALLSTDSLFWVFGLAAAGFILAFSCLTYLQTVPSNKELRQSFQQLPVVKAANSVDLARAEIALDLAGIKLEYDKAFVQLDDCSCAFHRSKERYEQVQKEYNLVQKSFAVNDSPKHVPDKAVVLHPLLIVGLLVGVDLVAGLSLYMFFSFTRP